jgi:hypothetical protein
VVAPTCDPSFCLYVLLLNWKKSCFSTVVNVYTTFYVLGYCSVFIKLAVISILSFLFIFVCLIMISNEWNLVLRYIVMLLISFQCS